MVGAQGQVKWAKVPYKSFSYDVTHKKSATCNQNTFFQVQTRRLAASFDASTRSVTRTGAEKFPFKAMCVPVFFFLKIPKSS